MGSAPVGAETTGTVAPQFARLFFSVWIGSHVAAISPVETRLQKKKYSRSRLRPEWEPTVTDRIARTWRQRQSSLYGRVGQLPQLPAQQNPTPPSAPPMATWRSRRLSVGGLLYVFRKMDNQLIYKAHYGPADGPFKILLKKILNQHLKNIKPMLNQHIKKMLN